MSEKMSTRTLTFIAMIAAVYTALCLALGAFAFGPLQIRVAEALTLLPIFSPVAIWGVTLGCALANLFGAVSRVNLLGYLDIVFGTAATLLAALLSYRLRGIRFRGLPVLSAIPPILVNAVVIGAELAWVTEMFHPTGFLIHALSVGAGQAISCFVIGLPFVWFLEKSGAARYCFG